MSKELIVYLLIVLCFLFFSCTPFEYNVGTHSYDFVIYSTEKEINLGINLSKQIKKDFSLLYDPRYIKRVNNIGEKVANVCDRQEISYYFYVLDDSELNAFSLPGGYVYVNKGLMDILDDDELAFVIAHEIGHIVARHHIKKLQAALGANLLLIASTQASSSPGFTQDLSLALTQIFTSYSQEDEFLSDELAAKYTKEAGFNPQAGIKVLEKLRENYEKKPPQRFSYFRTHPSTSARIKNIKKSLGLPLDVKDYIN